MDSSESAGLLVIAVDPINTTQNCSSCGKKVPKDLSDRWHSCPCGCSLSRDHNAAINIRNFAAGHPVSKAYRVTEAVAGVGKKPALPLRGQSGEYVTSLQPSPNGQLPDRLLPSLISPCFPCFPCLISPCLFLLKCYFMGSTMGSTASTFRLGNSLVTPSLCYQILKGLCGFSKKGLCLVEDVKAPN